jgi:hypothetical protein
MTSYMLSTTSRWQILIDFNQQSFLNTWQLKKVKHVFDRRDSRLECFNRATQNYALQQHASVKYRMRKTRFLSLPSLTRSDNERLGVYVLWLYQWWLMFVLLSNSYIFICNFLHHGKSIISTPVFNSHEQSIIFR